MNTYICMYWGSRLQWECQANSLYEAKLKAVAYFKAPKSKRNLISVVLIEVGSKPVFHSKRNFENGKTRSLR
jgi:hypothetical protein